MLFPARADYSEWGLLALRLAIGAIFVVHGWPKITGARKMAAAMSASTPAMVGLFTTQGFVESLGGIALALGLLTQLVAIAFGVIMSGAIILKLSRWKTGFMAQQSTGWEFDLVLLAGAILLLLNGPGDIAIQS